MEVALVATANYSPPMLEKSDTRTMPDVMVTKAAEDAFVPFETIEGDVSKRLILLCDHARNDLPPGYGSLGLPQSQLDRHIGYDIGAAAVTRMLAKKLNAPAVLSCFSRLLIDPNRGPNDPTLVMRLSDGAVVPGNAYIDQAEIERRKANYYMPYHQAITNKLDGAVSNGTNPVILSIHSFTPNWRGTDRPWHCAVLWDEDDRFPNPLIEALRADSDLVVGDNEPYTGKLEDDTMNSHGTKRGLAHALLEIRQDLIADDAGAEAWAERLARLLPPILETSGLQTAPLSTETK